MLGFQVTIYMCSFILFDLYQHLAHLKSLSLLLASGWSIAVVEDGDVEVIESRESGIWGRRLRFMLIVESKSCFDYYRPMKV
jgi:hypothetical protein